MKLTCPGCGFTGDLVAYLVEGEARQVLALLTHADWPARLPALLVRYLSLFKPADELAISWTRAHSLLRDLLGHIPNHPAAVWVKSVESVLDMAKARKISLPLIGHGFLYGTANNIGREHAQMLAANKESRREEALRAGQREGCEASAAVYAEVQAITAQIKEHRDALDSWRGMLAIAQRNASQQLIDQAQEHIQRHEAALQELKAA
jgi:hypothetical protein